MKLNKIVAISAVAFGATLITGCHDLDLNPLSSASTGNWYQDEQQITMAVNDLYRIGFWREDRYQWGDWSDDFFCRDALNVFENGGLNGQTPWVNNLWKIQYKAIARANSIINNAHRAISNGANPERIDALVGEAKFHRASAYSKLVMKWGDVPMTLEEIDIEKGLSMGRTAKAEVLKQIYQDFDDAAKVLPKEYTGAIRATKGAALAMKARIALVAEDWKTASDAAKAVMDLNVYELHPDFRSLFLAGTKVSKERIFCIPRALGYNSENNGDFDDYYSYGSDVNEAVTELFRCAGGWGQLEPTWDLMAAYTCTDGLPIDKSPLFDGTDPFKNRDPRLSETIIPWGSTFLGIVYNPRPDAAKTYDYNIGDYIVNKDSYAGVWAASFNGLCWKKGIDETWRQNGNKTANDIIWMRYADVLLMYAEAMIEQGIVNDDVVGAMNAVRARAYGVDPSDVASYPAFTKEDPAKMRNHIRVERRMEFAKEGRRYTDMIRWRQAEKVMNRKIYGIPDGGNGVEGVAKLITTGKWLWPFAPKIDEDGCPDFTALEATGDYRVISQRKWDNKMYLWPIPTNDMLINKNLENNDGY